MEQPKTYENYPCWIIFISNIVSCLIYLIGAYIIYQLGIIWLVLYLLYIVYLETRLLKKRCVNCYYYGKYCAFGKGKISAIFFKKGNPQSFHKINITWKDVIPDFLVSLIPFIIGIILIIANFNWLLLILLLILFFLASAGSGFVRTQLACKFCKQKELGCPAEKLFDKKRKGHV